MLTRLSFLLTLSLVAAAGCTDSSISDLDASGHDVAVVEDGATDDGAVEDGATDDGAVEDADIDDGAVDDGSVEPTVCSSNIQCKGEQFCLKEACLLKGGVCTDRPSLCEPVAEVCGCNGITYASECDAHAAGTNVDFEGACAGCESNAECDKKGQYCAAKTLDEKSCAAAGSCEVRPTVDQCESEPTIPEPVCGCDGNLYTSACHAAAAGVRATLDESVCKIVIDPPIITAP